jgi:hypothetical protein
MNSPATEMCCNRCGGAIEAGRCHAVDGHVLCDRCALHAADQVLDALQQRIHAEQGALDVIRQFACEHMAGCWQWTKP